MLNPQILNIFTKKARYYALKSVVNANSGHPGGSFSSIDFLSVLYLSRLIKTNEKIVISNGHISPAIYSILGCLNVVDVENFAENFRQSGSQFEGHVNRFVDGCFFSTGPLGSGFAAGVGMSLAEKVNKTSKKVFVTLGDGEIQEGIVYESAHFASKYNLDNLVCLVDYNRVQLSDSLQNIMPMKIKESFQNTGFEVIECDGHDYLSIQKTLASLDQQTRPVLILFNTVMGKGSLVMEEAGLNCQSTWHGKSPKKDEAIKDFENLQLTDSEEKELTEFLDSQTIKISSKTSLSTVLNSGDPRLYTKEDFIDCRTAYGNALSDLGALNPEIVALTADLGGSVKTNLLKKNKPNQVFEVGIAEQAMVAIAGGLSLSGLIPFASTFGVFMTSRARGQARLNDINHTNVKMVATHCGVSLGEDGPTHQALDDFASIQPLKNTTLIEPADANQTDHVIRYIASHPGNFYVRLGRHKHPVLLDKTQNPVFSKDYKFDPKLAQKIEEGDSITVLTLGSVSYEVLQACRQFPEKIDLFITPTLDSASSKEVLDSIQKTKKLLVVQDHFDDSGLATFLSQRLLENKVYPEVIVSQGIKNYQLSGKQKDLYKLNKIDSEGLTHQINLLLS